MDFLSIFYQYMWNKYPDKNGPWPNATWTLWVTETLSHYWTNMAELAGMIYSPLLTLEALKQQSKMLHY